MGNIKPNILIVSNRYDFASDYITTALLEKEVSFLRINKEDLPFVNVSMDPVRNSIIVENKNDVYEVSSNNLKSIYFRGPTFLREKGITLSADEQLSRSQWQAFIRALMIFNESKWVNNPKATYYAETKPVQLSLANQIGFSVPKTIISNSSKLIEKLEVTTDNYVVKSLDAVLLDLGERQAFVYTNIIHKEELLDAELSSAPVIIQELLEPKVDLRVTIVENEVFAVEILEEQKGIRGDWRLRKNQVKYIPVTLPPEVEQKCINLVNRLGLVFGAIDLVRVNNCYYFIEINPTGEWAWLIDQAEQRIDLAITRCLIE
ncbi:RimK-like protein [Heliobacillus mobilis]|uniref:RimK-like protein n=1 Tax=Heliobacterium mobile TaxID=28064 RepID=A0A6I3SGE7_HELMO|nr:RimK-like protein [Heliobacterium mobile]MTV47891.1 RimK-like protein [Heliobacterium mobile]